MINRIFSKEQPLLWIIWPLLVILFHSPIMLTTTSAIEIQSSGILHSYLPEIITSKWLRILIHITLLLLNGSYLKLIVDKHRLITANTFFIPLGYLLTTSLVQFSIYFHPILFASFFLLAAFDIILSFGKDKIGAIPIFNASILISIGSLLYYPIIYFTLLVWIGLFLFSSFKIKEWLVVLCGTLTPYLYALIFWYWNDSLLENIMDFKAAVFSLGFNASAFLSISSWVLIGITAIGLPLFIGHLTSNVIRVRYGNLFVLWVVIISLLIQVISNADNGLTLYCLCLFSSLVFSVHTLRIKRKIFTDITILLVIAAVVYSALNH